MENPFKAKLQKIEKLPTLPDIAQRVLSLTNNPLVSIDELKNILERDPAISSKILSVANSAFYGFPSTSNFMLHDAIMRIGTDTVKNIAVGISVLTLFGSCKTAEEYKRLFNHSVTVGLTVQLLNKKFRAKISGDILIDGLLHNLGYLLMNSYFPETYQEITSLLEDNIPPLDAEKKILNCTHGEIGYWLAEQWKLPDTILDINLYHHAPSLAKRNMKRVAIIHIADYCVSRYIISPFEKDMNYPFDHASLDILGITANDLQDVEESIGGLPFSDEMPDYGILQTAERL